MPEYPAPTPAQIARFFRHVKAAEVRKDGGMCWLWRGATRRGGYGLFRPSTTKHGPRESAHRFSYRALVGPIPDGLWVLHQCDTPACVNPTHLFLGTVKENIADMIAKGRAKFGGAVHGGATHCKHGHEFTPENTYRAPSQPRSRFCRACQRERWHRRRKERLAGETKSTAA